MESKLRFKPGDSVVSLKDFTSQVSDARVRAGASYEVANAATHWIQLIDCGDVRYTWNVENFKPLEADVPKLTGGSSDYYKLPPDATDIMDLIEHKEMSFALGNIFKAVYRLGDKPGTTRKYDLEKIIYFAQRELDRVNG